MMLSKDFSDQDELDSALDEWKSVRGLLLQSKERVESRSMVNVQILLSGKTLGNIEAEVVYTSPFEEGYQIGVEFRGDWLEILSSIQVRLQGSTDKDARKWGKDSESLREKIEKMSTHEKIRFALRCGREERLILLKDSHQMVHPYVLKNPKITTDEVSRLAKMPSMTAEMIQTISNNQEWMSNQAVRLAMVKNPRTPFPIVVKHLPKLRDNDLMQIAKSENVRDQVSREARKILARKGKVIR